MIKRKNVKSRGKIKLSQYFQIFKEGERVAIVRDQTFSPAFPERIQGKSGIIAGKKGEAYIIKLMDGNQEKAFIIRPIHLKRLA